MSRIPKRRLILNLPPVLPDPSPLTKLNSIEVSDLTYMSNVNATTRTRVYLLRHGATSANREVPYRLQGASQDLNLDELGLVQARCAGIALAHVELSAVYSSPLLRAMQTASAVASHRQLVVRPVPELTEANVGDWEGLTWDEVRERDPDLFSLFMANPGTVPYRNGESFQDVQNRCTPVINALAQLHPNQSIAIVGHNVVNRTYLASLLRLPISQARSLAQANGGINIIDYLDGRPSLITMNANLHLDTSE